MLAATEPQVIQQRRERVTNGGHSPVRTRRLRLIWLPVPQETTSPIATLTPLRMDPPPPPQHHAPATTPAAPPTPHQHRHQQWRNALTHATTIEGSPGQQRPCQENYPTDAHPSAHKSLLESANPRKDSEGASGCPWSTARATAPSPGRPTPGVVKQDKSSGGSVDTTKPRSGPQRVRMSSGERPMGAAKGKQSDTEALCQIPPPPPRHGLVNGTGNSPSPGRPTPGVVQQDKSSGGSVDTTKTRSGLQRVRMSSGERPMGAAKGKQSDTEALCKNPPSSTLMPRQAELVFSRHSRTAHGGLGWTQGSAQETQVTGPSDAACRALVPFVFRCPQKMSDGSGSKKTGPSGWKRSG